MKIVSHVIKKQIFRAMIIGGFVGLLGVAIFLGVLQASTQLPLKINGSEVANNQSKTETIPTAGETTNTSNAPMFFASQAGVYSNYESASSFVAEYPALKESAIVQVDGKFYVWTSMVTEESQLEFLQEPATFKKAFTVSGASCKEPTLAELPTALADKKATKLNFKENGKDSTLPEDWQSIGAAASTISNDVNIIRLHVFAHYQSKNTCLQVKF
ncbi:MAG TPA: hypothetical protein DEB37_15710 [Lysinibacillus sp.]|jgi:hypothetical protein|uniref:Uncharacterized protein n=1 Tax=Lysinibacillus fusiformis TaxID=28031 RepID=A0A2I0V1K0_9BACI|nr:MULTISPECIES: hypothetical protein [Lysinibacillus]HBT73630.1 hypothetical protein [Lysinibacillus sp.]KUF29954.1 hypothetical protein AK833_17965 [Lysinibacillus sp. F5]MEE3805681.1 hypothetical protein [Lysinibacillus fusiformis]PKU52177.1 hypothetical protein CRI88_07375 [Lysinibacillus fusiformis]WCH46613.1 hypothetical protein NV349_16170 [Lysinibacillus sp. OF-1]